MVAINNDIFLLRNDGPKDLIHKLIDMVYWHKQMIVVHVSKINPKPSSFEVLLIKQKSGIIRWIKSLFLVFNSSK